MDEFCGRWMMSWPFLCKASVADASVRRTGGWSGNCACSPITPMRSRLGSVEEAEDESHPVPCAVTSYFQGCACSTLAMNSLRSSILLARGPADGFMPGRPSIAPDTWPPNGMRSAVGLKPYTPQQSDGMRMEPAMSVPIPSGEPLNATRAPSPPLDPPAVRLVLWGFSVRPNMLLSESPVCDLSV